MKNPKHFLTIDSKLKIFLLTALMVSFAWSGWAAVILPGETVEGNINAAGVSNSWTFAANAGDAIVVRVGEELSTTFTPKIQLLSPASVSLGTASGTSAAELAVTATNSGSFTVIISDNSGTLTNKYRLSLAQTGAAITVDPGDQGGPMTNGVMHTGTILTGDLDSWTFTANAGDAIVVRAGEITDTNAFSPWVRIYGPNGKLLDSGFGTSTGEVTATATNSGTFLVVVGDGNSVLSGSGDYRLTLVKTGDPVVISAGDNGGPMTNAVMHLGTIGTGDLDVWTFTANTGDAISLLVGEITTTNTFTPWIRLYSPAGVLVGSGFGTSAGEIITTAPTNGTYLVVVGDGNSILSGSGDYRLTLAKTGDPVVISAGDQGGPMTNGVMHLGTISTGDLDVWTFTANTGDAISLLIGEVTDASGNFSPWIRLYSPTGVLVGQGFGTLAGEIIATAPTNGTYLVVAGDGNSIRSGSGDYRLTLAKTGDPVVISAGDQGGPMTNGVMHTGTILTGDLDLWTFTATAGDSLLLRVGEITDASGNFSPWVRVYSPSGTLVGQGFGTLAGEAVATAPTNGTYLVVVADGNSIRSGSGDYRLTLAKTGDPVVISAGDEGGPLTNGLMHTGTISTGDLDPWTFTANSGERFVVRVGEITDASANFSPWVRVYNPAGVLVAQGFGTLAGEATAVATNNGTYLVVVGDGNSLLSGSGDYRLTLAKTGSPFVTSAGDEGGFLNTGANPVGVISAGDMDVWTFTQCKGEFINLRLDELVDSSGNFTPWLRLFSPAGALLGSVTGPTTAQLNLSAPTNGTYTVLISDGNSLLSGTGTYQLTSNGLSFQSRLCTPVISGSNLFLTGVGGVSNAVYVLYQTTNVGTPQALWTPITTNTFDIFGDLSKTNLYDINTPQQFFRYRML